MPDTQQWTVEDATGTCRYCGSPVVDTSPNASEHWHNWVHYWGWTGCKQYRRPSKETEGEKFQREFFEAMDEGYPI